ncbi:MAG: ABC transporter substrate binding protein, partial [Eubacteriales bacterium]|nr:ABC transporter substrate binding protein [Eubacteriales bacterium]
GLEAVDYTVATSNDIQTVVQSMVGNVDAIYAPTDNVIAAGMPTVAMVANENQIPTIVGEEGMCNAGGLATYSIDYKELGKVAGEMAVRILTEGADPATMPIEYYPSDKLKLIVNEETAETLGLTDAVAALEQ